MANSAILCKNNIYILFYDQNLSIVIIAAVENDSCQIIPRLNTLKGWLYRLASLESVP